jgi:hypothetical protein
MSEDDTTTPVVAQEVKPEMVIDEAKARVAENMQDLLASGAEIRVFKVGDKIYKKTIMKFFVLFFELQMLLFCNTYTYTFFTHIPHILPNYPFLLT